MSITVTPEILRAVAASSDSHIVADELNKRAMLMEDPYHELIAGAEQIYERNSSTHLEGRNAAYKWLIDAVRDEIKPEVTEWATYAQLPEGVLARDNDTSYHWYFTRNGSSLCRVSHDGSEVAETREIDYWQREYDHLLPLTKVRDL
nr:hypothetical protein [Rhodococcus sp. (in: high G+C Gram-positive bacteria)]